MRACVRVTACPLISHTSKCNIFVSYAVSHNTQHGQVGTKVLSAGGNDNTGGEMEGHRDEKGVKRARIEAANADPRAVVVIAAHTITKGESP